MAYFFKTLSIRSKIMLMLILVCLISAVTLLITGYFSGKDAINKGLVNELTNIKYSKKHQIESYFKHLSNVVQVIGANPNTAVALKEFKSAYQELNNKELEINCKKELSDYYEVFMNKLNTNIQSKNNIELYYPNSAAACYLQYEYIVKNEFPLGEKNNLLKATDTSQYSKIHEKNHEYFNKIVKDFGFYDMFLIDSERGDIIYSVYKETDFGTNLYNGPYRESNLAKLTKKLLSNRDSSEAILIDFDSYRPSYGSPAAFIGYPITDGAITLGAVVFQLPIKEINQIMTGNSNWKVEGLGDSGETYLVGNDQLMRSNSRFFIEDKENFGKEMLASGVSANNVNSMKNLGTTILYQKINTPSVKEAFNGKIDTKVIEDYRGIKVLSSYAPLEIKHLDWAIISEIDEAEAIEPINKFRKYVTISSFIVLTIVVFLSMFLAGIFVKPIEKLTEGVRSLKKGEYSHRIKTKGKNEFTELASSFNDMIQNLDNQHEQIQKQNKDSKALLLNFIPEPIAKRLKNENLIADYHNNVSFIAIDIVGFSKLLKSQNATESITQLNTLVDSFDNLAKKFHIEKIRTVGDTYFASCGLLSQRLDHSKRMIDFGIEVISVIKQFNINNDKNLHLFIGIHSGDAVSGIIGKHRFTYDVIGETVNTTFELLRHNLKNKLVVTQAVYNKLEEIYSFEILENTEYYILKKQD